MPTTIRPLCFAPFAVFLLAACGGGGGGSDGGAGTGATGSPSTSATDSGYAVAAALKQTFQQGYTTTVRGPIAAGTDATIQVAVALAGNRAFEGTVRDVVRITSATSVGGGAPTTSGEDHYVDLNTMTRYGQTYLTASTYIVASDPSPIPVAAKPGDQGSLGNALIYTDSTKTGGGIPSPRTWSLTDIDGSSAWFCWHSTVGSTGGGNAQVTSTCFRLTRSSAGTAAQVAGMKLVTSSTFNGVTTVYAQQ